MRWGFGFSGDALVDGAVDVGCTYCTTEQVIDHLETLRDELDVDGDGEHESLTDGLLLLRWGFSFADDSLVEGAVDQINCTRCTATEIQAYLDTLDGQ
jgi:hypothetical protein